MKPLHLLSAVALAATLPLNALANPEVGKPAPAFTAVDSNGKRHALSDFRGKTVVLEWTNAQCPFVVKHYDTNNMQTLQRDATKAGVVWLTINSGAPGKQGHLSAAGVNAKKKDKGFGSTAYLIDETGAIGQAYAAKTTPHMFVINPQGTLVYMGAIDSDRSSNKERVAGATNYVRAALAEVAAGKPVTTPVTQPYGCSVKYAS
jgi:peroxiredoxin